MYRQYRIKNHHLMRSVCGAILVLVLFVSSLFFFPSVYAFMNKNPGLGDEFEFNGDFPSEGWYAGLDTMTDNNTYITYTDYRDDICTFASTLAECDVKDTNNIIRIDTAEELYRFSIDVSFQRKYASETEKFSEAQMTVILNQDYALGNDIDFSSMNAKTFAPIGFWFTTFDEIEHKQYFTGTFNGQGFVISNLYVGGEDDMIFIDYEDDLPVDLAVAPYYAIFTINGGTIANLGLIDPTLEMLEANQGITKTANLVGSNLASGYIDHVYVIDTRESEYEAGIRYKGGSTAGGCTAAGIVHTNDGTITNAYYSSIMVVNGSYYNKFISQPVLYVNNAGATIGNLVYDSTVYDYPTVTVGTSTFNVALPNGNAVGEATNVMKSSSSSLNTTTDHWYFYPDDCYPLSHGLIWDDTNDVYLIQSAVDMVFFSHIIGFETVDNGVSYAYASYYINQNIDMGVLALGSYITPEHTFYGTLSGANPSAVDNSDNYYLYNLSFTKGTIRGVGYYTGLFSILSGTVQDLNITDTTIDITDTETYYSDTFYIGVIAGRLSAGLIKEVLMDVSIDLGTSAIGKTYLGAFAGMASGTITKVAVTGTINANSHTFNSAYSIFPTYYIGGIAGATGVTKLSISNVVNNTLITGFATASTFSLASGSTAITIKIGGVIGYILNTSTIKHSLVNVANKGNITAGSVINTVELPSSQNVGGVFGELAGNAPVLQTGDTYQFANLYNSGNISATYASQTAIIKAAGIGISNASEIVEYALMFNHGSFTYGSAPSPTTNPYPFRYTGTIYDVGSSAVTISRAYNYGDQVYSSAYYTNISPLYYSQSNNSTLIRYSANYGDISFLNSNGTSQINLGIDTVISGITSSSNINYLNVANYGDISAVNLNLGSTSTAYTLSVAGITSVLSADKYMENCLNEGKITVAKIVGTSTISGGYGNIYIGGLVNVNYSGNLHEGTQPTLEGIYNSVNSGEITTSYGLKTDNLYGISGSANTFAGGIATLNSGSIQDCANLGAIRLYNSSTGTSYLPTIQTVTAYAGRITAYKAGVSAGGVVCVTLNGNARIYDSANNGEITTKAYYYARSGGVLSTCLYTEAIAGGITYNRFGTYNSIDLSVLLNGLNFGNITALTYDIGDYNTYSSAANMTIYYNNPSTQSRTAGGYRYFYSTTGTADRPAVYSSAGGVIGYGLCIMECMLNHGTISAMDVAGGIVGATYVIGAESGNATTTVNITTAINYGEIKAINYTNFNNIDSYLLDYEDDSSETPVSGYVNYYHLADGDTSYIFPTGYTSETPGKKRGFGGVFGRLQRGTNGWMTSEDGAFDFVVNANPNIDLIGRMDQVQNWTSSGSFFCFETANYYYSAKVNDTTQVVFSGFYLCYGKTGSYTGSTPRIYNLTPTTRYTQIGMTSANATSYTTVFTFPSTTNYSSTNIYMYQERIPIPWITEDISETSNPDDEYMYDEDFPMRAEETLTDFIYYMEYNLLADRFRLEIDGGTEINPRENGMYVLSSTEGSTVGAVLPANLKLDKISGIDEDAITQLSLLVDYTMVPTENLLSMDLKNLIKQSDSSVVAIEGKDLYNTQAQALADAPYFYYSGTLRASDIVNLAGTLTYTYHDDVIDYWTYDDVNYILVGGDLVEQNTPANIEISDSMLFTTQALAYEAAPYYYFTGTVLASNIVNLAGTITYVYTDSTVDYWTNDSINYVFAPSLEEQYNNMKQTRFNEKTALFNAAGETIILNEDDGDQTVLDNGTLTLNNNGTASNPYDDFYELHYSISMEAFANGSHAVDYLVVFANTSANALIAKQATDQYDDGNPFYYYYTGTVGLSNIVNTSGSVTYTFHDDTVDYWTYNDTNYVLNGGNLVKQNTPSDIAITDANLFDTLAKAMAAGLFFYYSGTVALSDITDLAGDVTYVFHDDTIDYWTYNSVNYILSGGNLVEQSTPANIAIYASNLFNDENYCTAGFLKEYRSWLYEAQETDISEMYPSLLNITIPLKTIPDDDEDNLLGVFTIYSEAFVGNDLFASNHYYTNCYVYITFTPTIDQISTGFIGISTVQFNGGATQTVTDQSTVIGLGNVNPAGSITFNFSDTKGVLTTGQDLSAYVTLKYSDGTVVNPEFYTKTATLVTISAGTGTGSVTITFSPSTRGGNYYMYYRYFSSSTLKNVIFNKTKSSSVVITDVDHYSIDESLNINGTNITSSINLGYEITIENAPYYYYTGTVGLSNIVNLSQTITYTYHDDTVDYWTYNSVNYILSGGNLVEQNTPANIAITDANLFDTRVLALGATLGLGNFSSATDSGVPTYLDNKTYSIIYGSNYVNSLTISPFADVIGVYLNGISYNNGYKIYDIRIVITAENGTEATYIHTITERTIDLTSVLKNGNEIGLEEVDAAREDDETIFTIDLGLDSNLNLYRIAESGSLAYFMISATLNGNSIDPLEHGISFSVDEDNIVISERYKNLDLIMSYEAEPGDYVFTFILYRDDTETYYVTVATTLTIIKNKGESSHLTDIKFSELANETSYPDIYITSDTGSLLTTSYNPQVYFAGIDYDGADAINTYHYRIDGKVSNVPLNEYAPFMTDYLPYGATIARHYYNVYLYYYSGTAELSNIVNLNSAITYTYHDDTVDYWTYNGVNYILSGGNLVEQNTPANIAIAEADLFDTKVEAEAEAWTWTDPIGANATDEEKQLLVTDFTVDPATGQEIGEDVIIQYRVVSEDEAITTYYFITVTDVTYNVTLTFGIYYCTGLGDETCTLASESVDFANQLVMVTVRNYNTDGDEAAINISLDPLEYPTFSEIQGLNNQMTQFYLTYSGYYQYSFGRNISGFYVISLDLPQDQYMNDIYEYSVKISDYTLIDASEYVDGLEGKYFFIEGSTKNRTRKFSVYIREIATPATDSPWGLYEFFRSWWDDEE